MKFQKKVTLEELKVQLSDEMRAKRAKEATELFEKLSVENEEFSVVQKEHREKIKPFQKRIRECSQAAVFGFEYRHYVKGTMVYDLDLGRKYFVYDGIRYDEQEIDEKERLELVQRPIFGPTEDDAKPIDDEVEAVIHEESRVKGKTDHVSS